MKPVTLLLVGCILLLIAGEVPAQKAQPWTRPAAPARLVVDTPSNNTILLQYEKMMNDDMTAHREYVDGLLKYLGYFIAVIVIVSGGLVGFFGAKSFRESKKVALNSLNELYEKNSRKMLDEHLRAKIAEIEAEVEQWRSKVMAEFTAKLELQVKELYDRNHMMAVALNGRIASLGNILRQMTAKIPGRATIRKSRIDLRYLVADGSQVAYEKYQEVICEYADDPVSTILENLALSDGARITDIDPGHPHAMVLQPDPNSYNITYSFTPPMLPGDAPFVKKLGCKIWNGFTGQKEWWIISQISPCLDEVYRLHFLKERLCRNVYVEMLDLDDVVVHTFHEGIVGEDTEAGQVFTITIPVQEPPYKCKIVWEF